MTVRFDQDMLDSLLVNSYVTHGLGTNAAASLATVPPTTIDFDTCTSISEGACWFVGQNSPSPPDCEVTADAPTQEVEHTFGNIFPSEGGAESICIVQHLAATCELESSVPDPTRPPLDGAAVRVNMRMELYASNFSATNNCPVPGVDQPLDTATFDEVIAPLSEVAYGNDVFEGVTGTWLFAQQSVDASCCTGTNSPLAFAFQAQSATNTHLPTGPAYCNNQGGACSSSAHCCTGFTCQGGT